MNKKYLIYIVLIILAIGIALFFMRSKLASEKKFFSPSEIKPEDIVVKITDQGFEPDTITIKKGQRVVWVNETTDFVWPASDPHPTHSAYAGFDPEEPLGKGEAWAFVFKKIGNWGVHDHLRPGKRGRITVTE